MARRRKKRTLKPRVPSRVKRRKRAAKEHSHHHPELIGLGRSIYAVGNRERAAYLWCADGILVSKAAVALLGKAGREATTRNWATVLKIRDLLQGDARPPRA